MSINEKQFESDHWIVVEYYLRDRRVTRERIFSAMAYMKSAHDQVKDSICIDIWNYQTIDVARRDVGECRNEIDIPFENTSLIQTLFR